MATTLTTSYKLIDEVTSSTYSKLRLYGKYNTQSTTNNTTTLTLELRLYGNGGSGSFASGTAKINSSSTTLGNTSYSKGKETTLKTYTYTVTHDVNGNYINKVVTAKLTSSAAPSGEIESPINLPNIPRVSELITQPTNIGQSANITINRKSSNYKDTITYECENLTGTIVEDTELNNVEFLIPTAIYTLIPNDKQKNITLTCKTYNKSDDKLIGTSTTTLIAKVDENTNKPLLTYTKEETTSTLISKGETTFENCYINLSKPKFVLSATGVNGASIVSYSVKCLDGQTINSNTATFNEVTSNVFQLSTTDSRGITNAITLSINPIEYKSTTFEQFELKRQTIVSSNIKATISGTYLNSVNDLSNTLTISYKYRSLTGENKEFTQLYTIPSNVITIDEENNKYSISNYILQDANCTYKETFEFVFYVYDAFQNESKTITATIIKGVPTFNAGEHNFNVNGEFTISDEDGENPIDVKEIIESLYFKPNDEFEFETYINAPGMITSSTTSVFAQVVMPKSLKNITSATCLSYKAELRGIKGYLNSTSGSIQYVGKSNYEIRTSILSDNVIQLILLKSSAFTNIDNNTPVFVRFENLKLKLS